MHKNLFIYFYILNMRCLKPKELNHSLKVRQLKREPLNSDGSYSVIQMSQETEFYYPLLPIILLMWGFV